MKLVDSVELSDGHSAVGWRFGLELLFTLGFDFAVEHHPCWAKSVLLIALSLRCASMRVGRALAPVLSVYRRDRQPSNIQEMLRTEGDPHRS